MLIEFEPEKNMNEILDDIESYLKLPLEDKTPSGSEIDGCHHLKVYLDAQNRTVQCQDCKKALDPFWYLRLMAKEWHLRRYKDVQALKARRELQEASRQAEAKERVGKVLREKVDQLKESEADFATWLEDCFKLYGWRFHHSRPARTKGGWRSALTGAPGCPDYPLVVRGSRLLVIEIKSETGKLTKEQEEWKEALRYTPIEYYLWRPADRDWIEGVLK